MHVREWMSTEPATIKPKDSVLHARELLETQRIRQLPVAVNNELVGIVTDRDLRDAFPSVFAEHRTRRTVAPESILVDQVMSTNVITLGPDDLLEDAARLMERERFGALPIVVDGAIKGILTRSDVLRAFVALTHSTEWTAFAREALRPV